ncbi:peptidoglycan-binding protein [Streptomyces sp. NPDC056411]|uniref:peptidoglycan-binding domain-containing protein n=1 Tax=Streptomyces sp. NPDC056411 TaxID=3345813 RepID=UPI0035E1AD4F
MDAAVHRADPAPYGADAYGVEAYGVDAYEADAYGADAYEADAYGADAYEANAYGAELHAADVSEPLVRRAQRPGGPSSKTHRSAPGEPAVRDAAPFPTVDAAPAPARRRRTLPVVLAAAGAAVAATAVILSTDVLSGRGHDRAAPPDGGVAPPPATSPSGDDPAPTPSGTPAPSGTAGSPAPSPTALGTPETTVRRYRTTRPPHPPAPTRAAGTVTESPSGGSPSAPPTGPIVLREGSNGPEVAELQERLRQLTLYGDTADGRYDTAVRAAVSRYQQAYGVLGDPDGVYGTATRTSLESRTQEP